METNHPILEPPKSNPAEEYRAAHRNQLMVFTKIKGATPEREEFCRISSVETLAPSLWLTVNCLDGSTKRLRPEKIRSATEDEERLSNGLSSATL